MKANVHSGVKDTCQKWLTSPAKAATRVEDPILVDQRRGPWCGLECLVATNVIVHNGAYSWSKSELITVKNE